MTSVANPPPIENFRGEICRLRVGDVRVTALSDGSIRGGEGILRNIDLDKAETVLRAANRFPTPINVNAFLIEQGNRRMLIDTGSGPYMGRNAGQLSTTLQTAGFSTADIDTVLLTHIHPDHVGGLTDRSTGEALFPNAELAVNRSEFDFWLDDAEMARANEDQRGLFFACPREQIAPYRQRLNLFEAGEIFPGVTAINAPGHTPGHVVCMVQSGDERLLIWGDVVHVPEVQTAYPQTGVVFDRDPAGAIVSRRRVFDMAATDEISVMGMHVGLPGPMRLHPDGDGYRLASP